MRRRGALSRIVLLLLTVGLLATVAAAGDRWIDRQLLGTGRWTHTSAHLIDNGDVRRSIADLTARRTISSGGVRRALGSVLPGALVGHVQSLLERTAADVGGGLLGSVSGRAVWTSANRQTQTELLAELDGSRPVGGGVTLDISTLERDLLGSLARRPLVRAIPGSRAALAAIPAPSGGLVILRPAQVRALRGDAHLVRVLAWALPLAALAAFALALALTAGERLRTLGLIGGAILAAGALVLLARLLARRPLAHALVHASEDRAAVRAAWTIATSELRTEGYELLGVGVFVITAAWITRRVRGRR